MPADARAMPPILPPATIGILGGGQLGRMLGLAARAMGYRLRVLDPDPGCPAAAIADHVEVGSYRDAGAALRMAQGCAVVTYELEHIDAALVAALSERLPVRPGLLPLRVTQDRLAERRFVEANDIAVAPWREVVVGDDDGLRGAVGALGVPARLKAAFGGYDGRSQVRIHASDDLPSIWTALGRPAGEPVLVEQELDFASELSVVCARGVDGDTRPYPPASNIHREGILAESVLPAQVPATVAVRAQAIAVQLAGAMDLVGLLTVELFLLRDGRLVVNELAPRVHNSGHATIEASATSQFEQHIRAICGLGLGSTETLSAAVMLNLIGDGTRRPARLLGADLAMQDPAVHLHLYDKREVFQGRKMGHLTALGPDAASARDRASVAHAHLRWDAIEDRPPAPAADGPESAA